MSCRLLFYITFILLVFHTKAAAQINLFNMDEDIYLEPLLSYQKLNQVANSYSNADTNKKLWWLVRKAQCENLLYFYNEFNETVKKAQ